MEYSEDVNPQKQIFIAAKTFKELILESDVFVDKSSFIDQVINFPVSSIIITRPRRWGKSMNLDMLKNFLEYKPNEAELQENRKLFEGEDVCKVNTNKIESEENKALFDDKHFSTNQIEVVEKKELFEDKQLSTNQIEVVENKKLFEGESKAEFPQLAKNRKFKSLNIYNKKNERFYKKNIGKRAVIFLKFNISINNINSENVQDILRKIVRKACEPYEYLYQQYLTKRIKKYLKKNNITADISKESLEDLED